MKLTQLIQLFAFTFLILSVQSGKPWNQDAPAGYKNADGSVLTEGQLAQKFWIYANTAYCAERKVDAQTCNPCKFVQPPVDGVPLETAKSWVHNGAIVFVYYDKLINKVVVTYRGTEGMSAIENWRTNLDIMSTVTQCKSLGETNSPEEPTTDEKKRKHRLNKNKGVGDNVKKIYENLKSVVSGLYQVTEHLAQATVGNTVQFARQSVGNQYYKLTGDDYKCYLHHGFWGNTHGLMHGDEVKNYIKKLYDEKHADGLAFTGHSLGGAMATVAASSFLQKQIEDLDDKKEPELKVASLHTYGSPQVGDKNFQRWFDKETQALGIISQRFVHNDDLVTKSMGYVHVGKQIRYSNTTKTYTDCGIKVTDEDKNGQDDPDCFKTNLAASIDDHSAYFGAEVLTGPTDKCNMRDDQEKADDDAYQREKLVNAKLGEKVQTAMLKVGGKKIKHRLNKHQKKQ